jgi:hypothetical protein
MPKDFLVHAAQAYIAQPVIQIGYKVSNGGLGTVRAITSAQPTEIAHANNSKANRTGCDLQSSPIQVKILATRSIKVFCLRFRE